MARELNDQCARDMCEELAFGADVLCLRHIADSLVRQSVAEYRQQAAS